MSAAEPPFSVKCQTQFRTAARLVPTGEAGKRQAAAVLRTLVQAFAASVVKAGPAFWPPSRLLLDWTWRVEVDVGSAQASGGIALPFPAENGTGPPSAAHLGRDLLALAAAELESCSRTRGSVDDGSATRLLTRFALTADHGALGRSATTGGGAEEVQEEPEVLSQPQAPLQPRHPCVVTALLQSVAGDGGPSFREACAALGLSQEERRALVGFREIG